MPSDVLLITGTDTGVGKTTVGSGLAAALYSRGKRVGVLKPAETGCEPSPSGRLVAADARRLAFFARSAAEPETICPYRLRDPLAPSVAAAREDRRIDPAVIEAAASQLRAQNDLVLVEGAGGLMVPIVDRFTYVELCRQLRARLLVVVGNRLGAVNHALLTVLCAEHAGLRLAGYVINTVSPAPTLATETNVALLTDWLGPPLGIIPWLGDVRETDADRDRLARVFTEAIDLNKLFP